MTDDERRKAFKVIEGEKQDELPDGDGLFGVTASTYEAWATTPAEPPDVLKAMRRMFWRALGPTVIDGGRDGEK